MKYCSSTSGFTFAELIITITIVSILGTIGILSFLNFSSESRDAARTTDINNIKKVLSLNKVQSLSFPTPSNGVNINYSGATVWTQGVFGKETMAETGKIFGDLIDPKYGNQYTYSVTNNKREYMLGALYENGSFGSALFGYEPPTNIENPFSVPNTYAASPFSPLELNPIIWLDARDLNGDGTVDTGLTDGQSVSSWTNKGTLGASGNPTFTNGNLLHELNSYNWSYPSILVQENRGLLLNNSQITQGSIFFAIQNRDTNDWDTENEGIGLQSSSEKKYYLGFYDKRRDALRIGNAPDHSSSSPATKSDMEAPYFYNFNTNNSNYDFYNRGHLISNGATNSISDIEWALNKAGKEKSEGDYLIADILIFDYKLSVSQRQKVEGYIAHKWQMQWVLPWGHPYRIDAPESSGPPPAPDTTPDSFVLDDVSSADLSTQFTSNTITVSGINAVTSLSIVGGEYSKNSGGYTGTTGTVSLGDTISVRLMSSSSNSTAVTATLSIGGVSENFVVTTLVADDTPDTFQFNPVNDADSGKIYFSNTMSVSGLNTSVPISITGSGAMYKIGTGVPGDVTGAGTATASASNSGNNPEYAFDNNTSNLGWGNNGSLPAQLSYDFGSGKDQIITSYSLLRNSSQNGGWSSDNYSPKNWTLEGSNNGSSWTILDTQTNERIKKDKSKRVYEFDNTKFYRYYRINISSATKSDWVNITELELISENPGIYTSSPGTVSNGSIVTVKMPASMNAGTLQTAALTIGTLTGNFEITTEGVDTIPDTFAFIDVTNASLNTSYISNTLEVSGINAPTTLSVSGGGEYSLNNAPFATASTTVEDGDEVRLRLKSSPSNSVTVSSTLTLGGVNATYNVSTPAPPPDTTPDAFSFIDETNVSLNTLYTSNTITITGINSPASLSITGGKYAKNGSNSYSSSATTVNSGDTITLQVTSAPSGATVRNVTLTVGGVNDTYSVTTFTPDTTPNAFSFTSITNAVLSQVYESNLITIGGINSASSVSISGAAAGSYSINGGTWQNSGGTVNNGDTLRVRNTAGSTGNNTTTITLTIGGVSSGFSITTLLPDTTPDAFSFQDVTDATLSAQYISTPITVSGINTPVNVTIVGGEYRIGATGTFTAVPGQISNGQQISVRLLSAITGNVKTSAVLSLGGVSDSFDVTTQGTTPVKKDTSTIPTSNVYITGDYNGLIAHAKNEDTHYILALPSIMSYDISNLDVLDIISEKKLVYNGYNNIPSSYAGLGLTMSGGFDFNITAPLLYEGTKEDLGSYGGLRLIDEGIKSIYNNFPVYKNIASYMDDYSLGYLEKIIGNIIGINPIKPFYCSDILQSKLVHNIAKDAIITANKSVQLLGIGAINDGITSTEGALDLAYESVDGNASIFFEWPTSKKIGYIKIYNSTTCCTSRLSGANIKLYDEGGNIIYSHALWDTTGDYVIDLDLEGIGQLHNVKKLSIQSVGGNKLSLREVEIFLGGNVFDGEYKVDKDGLGGQSPYKVYCDMTTAGGGWTRIGENYITNGNFSNQNHIEEFTFGGYNDVNDNLIVAHSTMQPPASLPNSFAMQQNGSASDHYELYFSKIPGEYFAQEIRLSAWVKGTTGSIFSNTLKYSAGNSVASIPHASTLETLDGWNHQIVRIPLEGLVDDFTWEVGKGLSGQYYITGLKMEVYYR